MNEEQEDPVGIRMTLAQMKETRAPKTDKAITPSIIQPDDYLLLPVAYSP